MSEAVDFIPGLERAFDLPIVEGSFDVETVDGTIPPFVRGTHVLNGPGRFTVGHVHYRNWLDGDGVVTAMRFDGGRPRITCRLVASEKTEAETEAGRPLFRTFGTTFDGDRLVRGLGLASPVNVSSYAFGRHLLAFGEQGLPALLDPWTLESLGRFDFDRQINVATPFSAHPKIDPVTGELFNFGIAYSVARPRLNLYRFAASGELVYRRWLELDAPRSMHDFALGPRHAVFYLNPHVLDMNRLIGGGSMLDALDWDPALGAYLLVADRETGSEVARIPVETGYCLHTINVFDDGAHLVVDLVELERPVYDEYGPLPDLLRDVPSGGPVRYVLDLDAGRVVERREASYRQASDFPHVAPMDRSRPYGDVWMLGVSAQGRLGRKAFDHLVHVAWPGTVEYAEAPAGTCYGGEPTFVPDPDRPNRGAIVVPWFDPAGPTTEYQIFDAHRLPDGPLARLVLPHAVRLGFHATWVPAGNFPAPQ